MESIKRYFAVLLFLLAGVCFIKAEDNIKTAVQTSARSTKAEEFTSELKNFSSTGTASSNGSSSYYSKWECTLGDVKFILSHPKNNMAYSGNNLDLYYGKEQGAYSLYVSGIYRISGYKIVFSNSDTSNNTTITPTEGGSAVTCYGSGTATLEVSGLNSQSVSFNLSTVNNENVAARVSSITVYYYLDDSAEVVEDGILFNSLESDYPYRIPALAVARNGSILAFSDYRPCGSDIGNGDVDIHLRISNDNGKMWGPEMKILDGSGSGNTAGYGDAAVIADCESDKVRLVCVTGDVIFGESGRFWFGDKIRVATILSEDNGLTWSAPKDITNAIYDKVDVKGLFFTSGRIVQSKQVKKEDYYRIYTVLCTHNEVLYTGKNNNNYVLYSDDFGETWNVLGGKAISSGDEAKCEELPNGNLLVSSRMAGGRKFNIFTYSDKNAATGSWGSTVEEKSKFSDVASCNGELLIVDAVRNSDSQPVRLLLHSLSRNNREKVSIYYKELDSYSSPNDFTQGWSDPYQVSNTTSAYSTMMLNGEGKISFFFEDQSIGSGYQMTYKNIDLSDITGGDYYYERDVQIEEDGVLQLEDGEHIGELEISANPDNSAQITVPEGSAFVDEIVLRYTVTPGEWNFISFPQNANVGEISNLEELGYAYDSTEKAYYVRTYSEEIRAKTGGNAWYRLEEPLVEKGRGYLFGVSRSADNPDNTPVEVVFRFNDENLSDYVNNIDVNMSSLLQYTEEGNEADRGWNYIGNPYFANLNLTYEGCFEYTNISPYIYVYVPENDTYLTYTSGTSDVMSVVPFSAFFVQATGNNPSVKINNASKNGGAQLSMAENELQSRFLRILLNKEGEIKYSDRTDIRISDEASDDFVVGEDALKMWGGMKGISNELATVSGQNFCSVNTVSESVAEVNLFLYLKSSGRFTLSIDRAENFDCAVLIDKVTGEEYDLLANTEGYSFDVTDPEEVSSRFVLRLRNDAPSSIDDSFEARPAVYVDNGYVTVDGIGSGADITVYDISGKIVERESVYSSSWSLFLPSGIYIFRIDNGEYIANIKVVV